MRERDERRLLEAYQRWRKEEGYNEHESLRVESTEDRGNGVYTQDELPDQTTLFIVPKKCCLSEQNCLFAKVFEGYSEEEISPWSKLVIAVMGERMKQNSFWKPYFKTLPSELHTPLFWTQEEVEELRGTSIYRYIGKDEIQEQYQNEIQPFFRKHRDIAPKRSGSFANFLYAGSIILAYSFTGEDGAVFLAPYADMLNHETGKNNARLYVDQEMENGYPMITTQTIGAKEECINSYGALGNAELLRKYGYCELDNPYDYVDIPLLTLLRILNHKLRKMKGVAYKRDVLLANEEAEYAVVRIDRSLAIPKGMSRLMDYLIGGVSLENFLDEVFLETRLDLPPDAPYPQVDMDNVNQWKKKNKYIVLRCLFAVEEYLKTYPTTLQEDLALWRKRSSLSHHHLLALQLRISEKKILTQFLDIYEIET